MFELIETGNLEARIGVPSALLPGLKAQEYVILNADGHEITGRLKSVVPQVDPATRTQVAVITIDSTEVPLLADGQLIRLHLEEKLKLAGFEVPVVALAKAPRGLWSVYVIEPDESSTGIGTIAARSVELLHMDSQTAVVRGAISGDERIIASGIHRIVPGQKVNWTKAATPSVPNVDLEQK